MRPASASIQNFHLLAKPVGARCNLDCVYCFYKGKDKLYPATADPLMSDRVLEAYIRQNILAQDSLEVEFAWQGGEPTLAGLDFFRRAIDLERRFASGKRITNTLQTNGILLDDAWSGFLAEHDFLVGLSLDGPEAIHDRYRRDTQGAPTFRRVMRGLGFLKKHRVEFNILACVTDKSAASPEEIYRFFNDNGCRYLQFIPVVEARPQVTGWSVSPEGYGDFLNAVFDLWFRRDRGEVFVMNFEWALWSFLGLPASACFSSPTCGRAMVIEHNGDIYSCDHFVYPAYRLGDILGSSLIDMVNSEKQISFGRAKADLASSCSECRFLGLCRGGCPKHRLRLSPEGTANNYLCPGYKRFFLHVEPYLGILAEQLRKEPA